MERECGKGSDDPPAVVAMNRERDIAGVGKGERNRAVQDVVLGHVAEVHELPAAPGIRPGRVDTDGETGVGPGRGAQLQERTGNAGDRPCVDLRLRGPGNAGARVVRGVRDPRVDEELMPGDADRRSQARLVQHPDEALRETAGPRALGIVGVVFRVPEHHHEPLSIPKRSAR